MYKGTTSGEGDISIGEGGISIPLSYLKEMSSFPKSDNKTTYKNRDEVKNKIKEIADYIYGDWEIDIEKDLDKVMPMGEIHGLDAMISLTKWGGFIEAIDDEFGFDIDADGVVVTKVDPNSEASEMGVQEGDLIQRVGSEKVNSKKEFKKLVEESKEDGAVLLLIKREDISRFYALDLRE